MVRFKLLILCLMFPGFASAQNYLLLKKNTRNARIYEGSAIDYRVNGTDSTYKGTLTSVKDSVIVLNTIDTVKISSLEMIRVYKNNFGIRLVKGLGDKLPIAGLYYIVIATINSVIFPGYPIWDWRRAIIAGSISGAGFGFKGLGYLIDHKTFDMKKWKVYTLDFQGLVK